MQIIREFELQETVVVERAIRRLCESLVAPLARESENYLGQWSVEEVKRDIRLGVLVVSEIVVHEYGKRDGVIDDFLEFAREKYMAVQLSYRKQDDKLYGRYRAPIVELFSHNVDRMIEFATAYEDNGGRLSSSLQREIEQYIRRGHLSTLIHEMTHAYDDFVSKGKYISRDYVQHDAGKGWDAYAQQNIEVNARYAEAIASLERHGYRAVGSFEDVYADFRHTFFDGWKTLSTEQQERLATRLYQWYSEDIRSEEERAILLSHIRNRASFQTLSQGEQGGPLTDSRVEIPQHLRRQLSARDVGLVNYVQESARLLVSGRYDRSEMSNPAVHENRYIGFSGIRDDLESIEKYEQILAGKSPEDSIYATIQGQIEKRKVGLRWYMDNLDLSYEDLGIIASRFK